LKTIIYNVFPYFEISYRNHQEDRSMENQLPASDTANQQDFNRIVEQHMDMLSRLLASDSGYRGLYGGLTKSEIHARKRLSPGEEITNWMSPEELATNIFRASQAEALLRREQVEDEANREQVHFQVGQLVRQALAEIGNTMPEDLPTPARSARQSLREELNWLKHNGEFDSLETPGNENK
jgi:hypothetical protein